VLTPSEIFDTGILLSSGILSELSAMGLLDAGVGKVLVGALCSLGILLAFVVIAGQMLVTLIESYICVSAGVIFLGFLGSRWTASFAEKYFGYCISIGTKLFVTYLIVGIGSHITQTWISMITNTMTLSTYLEILGGSLVFMLVSWQVPSIASAVLSGASLSLGSVFRDVSNGASLATSSAALALQTGKLMTGPAGKVYDGMTSAASKVVSEASSRLPNVAGGGGNFEKNGQGWSSAISTLGNHRDLIPSLLKSDGGDSGKRANNTSQTKLGSDTKISSTSQEKSQASPIAATTKGY
jgi:type IV secretion system protein TrbL